MIRVERINKLLNFIGLVPFGMSRPGGYLTADNWPDRPQRDPMRAHEVQLL